MLKVETKLNVAKNSLNTDPHMFSLVKPRVQYGFFFYYQTYTLTYSHAEMAHQSLRGEFFNLSHVSVSLLSFKWNFLCTL